MKLQIKIGANLNENWGKTCPFDYFIRMKNNKT